MTKSTGPGTFPYVLSHTVLCVKTISSQGLVFISSFTVNISAVIVYVTVCLVNWWLYMSG